MRKFLSLLCLFALCTVCVFSGESKNKKFYVDPGNLKITSDAVLVNVQGKWFVTDSLFSNDKGLYVEEFWDFEMGCREGYYPCRNCDRCIPHYYHDLCPICGKPA